MLGPRGSKMKRLFVAPVVLASLAFANAATPARAGGGDVAAGLIGGFAAGTIVGAAGSPARATTRHHRQFTLPRRPPAIGRADSQYGMGTEEFGPILPSKSASRPAHFLGGRCWSPS
jgi:hypothetical protein